MLFSRENVQELLATIKRITNRRFVRYGIPFLTLLVGGSFGLKSFTSLRYEYSNKAKAVREELVKRGIDMKKPEEVTLETEFEKIKDLDIETWTNVRGPRPWEEPVREQKKK